MHMTLWKIGRISEIWLKFWTYAQIITYTQIKTDAQTKNAKSWYAQNTICPTYAKIITYAQNAIRLKYDTPKL